MLTAARDYGLITKSNLILGMGETPDEVRTALTDLFEAGCDIVTITQYLRPTVRHHPVERWVKPEEFVEHERFALALGFAGVLAGPLVRSSYRAGRLYTQAVGSRPARAAGSSPADSPPRSAGRPRGRGAAGGAGASMPGPPLVSSSIHS